MGYITKTQAEKRLSEYNSGIQKETSHNKALTLREAWDDYTEYYETKIGTEITEGTFDTYKINSKKVIEMIGDLHLNELRRKDIEKLKVAFRIKYNHTNTTINKHLTELKKILEYMEEELGWFECPKIKRLPVSGTENPTPTFNKTDLETLISASIDYSAILRKNLYLYLNFMKYTSVRASEVSWIKWEDVNFDEDWIFIRSADKNKPGGYIPLVSSIKEILLEAYKKRSDEYVSPFRKSAYANSAIKRLVFYLRKPVEAIAFTSVEGISKSQSQEIWEQLKTKGVLHRSGKIIQTYSSIKETYNLGLSISFAKHKKKIIEILKPYLGMEIHPKMFRTSTATILSDEGVELSVVAGLLRHRNIQTTHRSYVKKGVQVLKKAIEGKL
ncbi:MAG: site-specific integrase [Candidatus Margulisbacteria bacterium]|nr:site-specific integrase [Candidatus Margulisiibacteriota bacterium]